MTSQRASAHGWTRRTLMNPAPKWESKGEAPTDRIEVASFGLGQVQATFGVGQQCGLAEVARLQLEVKRPWCW